MHTIVSVSKYINLYAYSDWCVKVNKYLCRQSLYTNIYESILFVFIKSNNPFDVHYYQGNYTCYFSLIPSHQFMVEDKFKVLSQWYNLRKLSLKHNYTVMIMKNYKKNGTILRNEWTRKHVWESCIVRCSYSRGLDCLSSTETLVYMA